MSVCGTSAFCASERERERETVHQLRGLLLASAASSELTEIRSCFNNKERVSSPVGLREITSAQGGKGLSEGLDCKL